MNTNVTALTTTGGGTWQANYYIAQQQPLLYAWQGIATQLNTAINAGTIGTAVTGLNLQNSMLNMGPNVNVRTFSLAYINQMITILQNHVASVVETNS